MNSQFKTQHIIISIAYVVLVILGLIFLLPLTDKEYFWFYNILLLLLLLGYVLQYFISRSKNTRIGDLENKIRELNKTSKHKLNSEDIALNYLPVGIILYDESEEIVYANAQAKDSFSNVLVGRNLKIINKDLSENISRRMGKFILNVYDKKFDIIHYPKNKTIYLFEVTDREITKEKHFNSTPAIGVMRLDNFNDATENLDFQDKANIQGLLLGAIDNWCSKHDIYFNNLRPEKTIIFLNRAKLQELMDENFEILSIISDISKNNDLRITISIGIAGFEASPKSLGDAAEEALTLAEDRGGDQVVVNLKNQPLKFYGGKTNTAEKRSKITAKVNSRALEDFIEKAEYIYIMPHAVTDVDAFGSAIGVLEMALAKKKPAKIVLDFDNIDRTCQRVIDMLNHEYVKLLEYIIAPDDAYFEINTESLLIIVDHHSTQQSIEPKLVEKTKHIVIIDHHRRIDNVLSEVLINYVEPYASSSVELVTELIDLYDTNVSIDPFEATVMLAGMIIDTNNFSYRTGIRTFEAAATLKRYGADPFLARLMLRESLDDIRTKSNLVNNARIIANHFAITSLTEEDKTDRLQLAKTADELLKIDNIIGSFAIGNIDDETVGVSARSLDKFNVSVVMEKLGGGGHLNNAAAQIKNSSIIEVAEKIEEIIKETYKEEATMKVILIKDVRGKGKKGDIIEVANGFGNYLLTSKQAIAANTANIKTLETEKTKEAIAANKQLEKAKELKEKIEESPIKLYVKIGESGKLFGSINSKQIADELKNTYKLNVDKRKIILDENIHSLGNYEVNIKLHKEVIAVINLQVLEEE
ncbi:50S ribosomal protein L9 [Candidatus Izemoplasma sp. B36]|uniref:50S ribosomal protein L9 n=1 Tax=Candidatus Izemoplasma sp. B36 TaxID=3242468 RepID=UPI0035589A3A